MPYARRMSARMSDADTIEDVSVVDVYDLASDIGKECETIIDKFGADSVTLLLPKVIHSLELLESLAVRHEKETNAVQELSAKILQLENDKVEKAEYRQRFEKEIEAIEEQWRGESAELVGAVQRLQEENRRLRKLAAGNEGSSSGENSLDSEVLERLTSTAERQRLTLRQQEKDLRDKQQLIESLLSQSERLTVSTRELKRKHKQLQNQLRTACEEKSELGILVQTQQKEIAKLELALKSNANALNGEGNEEEDDLPKYSTRELCTLLEERIDLKNKLAEAEEMLAQLRNEEQSSESLPSSSAMTAPSCCDDDDAPVQGPLPYEPEDAPWKKNQHSGIRKLWNEFKKDPFKKTS